LADEVTVVVLGEAAALGNATGTGTANQATAAKKSRQPVTAC